MNKKNYDHSTGEIAVRSPITTHILDTHLGKPARDVPIQLKQLKEGAFVEIASGSTDDDGRIANLLSPGTIAPGVYQMRFDTAAYHSGIGIEGFYPEVVVTFEIKALMSTTTFHFFESLCLFNLSRLLIMRNKIAFYINGRKVTVADKRAFAVGGFLERRERFNWYQDCVC